MIFRVPIAADGRRRSIQVEAEDEWAAQAAALERARAAPLRRGQLLVLLYQVSHAIRQPDGGRCAWGCCP